MNRQPPYSPPELTAIFTMAVLLLDLSALPEEEKPRINKRAMLRVLMAGPCPTRSRGSLEAKLMNVSGASMHVGGPIIAGYKPAPNCQRIMREIAQAILVDGDRPRLDSGLYSTLDPRETA